MSKWEARWIEATEAGSDYFQRIVSHVEPSEEPYDATNMSGAALDSDIKDLDYDMWDGTLPTDEEIKTWIRERFKTQDPFAVAARDRFPGIEVIHLIKLTTEVLQETIAGRTP